MKEKYIIEKGLERWYTSSDLNVTSDNLLDAHLFSLKEVTAIFKTHKAGFLRVEQITANCDAVVENLFWAIEECGVWEKGETWGDFYNGWRGFIREKCQDLIAEALSYSHIVKDIEKLCLDKIIKRRSIQ